MDALLRKQMGRGCGTQKPKGEERKARRLPFQFIVSLLPLLARPASKIMSHNYSSY
jgi:hypothetical protein